MKRIISSILSVIMVVSGFSALGTTAFAAGNVKEIWNIKDLYNVRNDLSGNYILMADIDMTEDVANGGDYCFLGTNGWNPIGSGDTYKGTEFKGVFDGNNHLIKGLRIETNTAVEGSSSRYFGLFANNSGTIKNLSISRTSIKCVDKSLNSKYIGAICGENKGTIENCHILGGDIDGYSYYTKDTYPYVYEGGLTGVNNANGVINKCSNNDTVSGSVYNGYNNRYRAYMYMGGLSGRNFGKIALSYNSGNLKNYAENYYGILCEGGITGDSTSSSSSITDCYNCGDVYNTTGANTTEDIYAISSLYTNTNSIKNCYNVGSVYYGNTQKGFSDSTVENCYYLEGKNASSPGAKSLSDAQMKKFTNYSGFDFNNTWVIDSETEYAYPQLRENRQDKGREIDTIEFKVKPSKTQYYVGDEIKADGKITVYYLDNTSEDVDITEDMLSGYDMSTISKQTVTVTYRDKSLTYDIDVVRKPIVVDVTLISGPDKTEFVRNTQLDYTGAVAKISYDDGTSENVKLTPSNTRGGDITKSGTYTVTYEYENHSVSFTIKVVPLKINGIKVKSLPTKTTYVEGQSIDTNGLEIILVRNDGTTETVKNFQLDYKKTPGKQTVTVSYEDYTTTFDVTYTEKQLTDISVFRKPTKTSYFTDEKFDKTGMIIMASYDNGDREEVTDYETSEITDEIGTQSIKITYGGKTTYLAIEVKEIVLESITITKEPIKTTYIIGSKFDATGMEVTANYNNGKSVVVTDYYVSPLPTTAGEGKVTISYGGKSTTIDVIIKEKEIVKIEVTPPEKTVYFKGEQLDTTGMVVTVYYNNKTSEEVTDYIISGFGDTDETNKVVVSYKEHTASFEVIIHNPTNKWVTTKKATCEDDGEKVMYCTTCDDVIKREVIKAIGHDYSEKVVDPTCTEKGYTEHTCKNCGDTYRDSYVAEKGHNPITDYGKPATCTENGLTEGSHCNVCGTVLVPQKVIPKLDHNYTSQVTSVASCTTRGSITYTCQNCGDRYVVYEDALGHDFKVTKDIPATCITAGYKEYTCSRCNENYSEIIPILGHKYKEKVVEPTCTAKGYTLHTCEVCGDSYKTDYVDIIDHNYESTVEKQPTCSETGIKKYTCTVCGDTYNEEIPKLEHRYVEKVVKPTCTAKGYTLLTCELCGDSYKKDYVDIIDHNYESTVEKQPTCSETGIKKYTCTVCGDTYNEEIEKLEHRYVEKVVKPTCAEKGYILHTCELCGDNYKTDFVDTVEHSYKSTIAKKPTCSEVGIKKYTCTVCGDTYNEEIEKLEHRYVEKVVKPTCAEKGYTLHTCELCGDNYKTDFVDTVEHSYKSTIAKKPTCSEVGIKKYTCTVCGDTYNEEIEKLEHRYVEKEVKPTCAEKGYTLHTCELCGDSYKTDFVDTVEHSYESTIAKQPTCNETGIKKYTCTVCGDTYNEEIEKLEHRYSEKTVPPTCSAKGYVLHTCELCGDSYKTDFVDTIDHEYKSIVAKQPTCNEVGIKQYTCTVCGDTYSEEIEKLEHRYSEKVVAPTCTTDGYTLHTCELCGDSYKDTYVTKLEHSYDSIVTREPTCSKEGIKIYTCATCGDTYTEKIPMIKHTVVTDKAISATYTTTGKTAGSHCSVCGKVIKAQKTVAKKKLSKPSSVKATAMTKAFKLNWKKVTDAKGYEIQYSYKSNFSGAKKITVKKGNTTSRTVKKLTGKKKVYIRIRAYYNDKNGKAYSTWVKVNVTTKK